jgi:hypothetical protein
VENAEISTANIEAVQGKLQELYEGLSDAEKLVVETLLAHAAEGSRLAQRNPGEEESIIIVGGRSQPLNVPLNPEVLVGLNPQPIPPGRSPAAEGLD